MKVVGQLILVESTEDSEIIELEAAVDEGVGAYRRKFPKAKSLLVYMSEKTRARWDINGSVGGVEAYRDDDIPYPYIWVIDARDKNSFSPKRID